MPLELDDREPPEDDPDAPAPAVSLLRARRGPMISVELLPTVVTLAHRARGPLRPDGDGAIPDAPASPARPDRDRTCLLMRSRPVDAGHRAGQGQAEIR
jgi:hypothetical protein